LNGFKKQTMKKTILFFSLIGMAQYAIGQNKKLPIDAIFKEYLVSRDTAVAKTIVLAKDGLYSFYCEAMLSEDSLKRIELLTRFIGQKPAVGLGEAYMNLCKDYVLADQPQKTIEMCTEAAKIDSNAYYAYYFRGSAQAQLENYDAAIEDATRSITIKPDFGLAYQLRGNVLILSEAYEEAEEDILKAIEIGDMPVANKVLLGVLHLKMEQYQQAIEDWEAVLKMDKTDEYGVKALIQKAQEQLQNGAQSPFQQLKLAANEIPKDYTLTNDNKCISIQVNTFYNAPEIYEALIGKVKSKQIQHFNHKTDSGSILYFEFEQPFKSERFLSGLIWGDKKPSKKNPETFYVKDNILIIWSFKQGSDLPKVSAKKIKTILK
jgi:tetratricopeptide (TPR) repeat protein